MSEYRLRIVHARTGQIVKGWEPGTHIETDLVDELCARTKAKGVGMFRTEAHVLDDIRAAFAEMLYELKKQVR